MQYENPNMYAFIENINLYAWTNGEESGAQYGTKRGKGMNM